MSLSLPSPCNLTSADLFNNTDLFLSRGLGHSTMHVLSVPFCCLFVTPQDGAWILHNYPSATVGRLEQ